MQVISSIIYFIIVLGILVFGHEFGHFLMARLSGMRVDAFALGMGFRLFGWNKITGFTLGKLPDTTDLQGHCDYRLCAFPIGGFCKIAGMVDESFDTNFQSQAPQKWEFRAKNPFKQAITISGGVLFNIMLAIIFFAIIVFQNGESTYKTTDIGTVSENSIGKMIGLQQGDKIISINNQKPENWNEVISLIAIDNLGKDLNIKVKRAIPTTNLTETEGEIIVPQGAIKFLDTSLFVDGKEHTDHIASEIPLGIEPIGMQTVVMDVIGNGLAKENGILVGDTIISVNREPVFSSQDFIGKLQKLRNQTANIVLKNNSGIIEKSIQLDESGMLGVQITSIFSGTIETIQYGLFGSIEKGAIQTYETLTTIISSIKQIIVGNLEFKKAIGGPVMIAKQAGQFAERGFYSFLSFTAMLSVSLALINILPLPALDGGHLVFIIIEAIIRKEVPIKAKLIVQQIGIVLLLSLMAYVIFNDIQKLF